MNRTNFLCQVTCSIDTGLILSAHSDFPGKYFTRRAHLGYGTVNTYRWAIRVDVHERVEAKLYFLVRGSTFRYEGLG